MRNDRYARIRDALAMGPTPGPWADGPLYSVVTQDYCAGKNPVIALVELIPAKLDECMANKSLICACDPDTIRELLDERDALEAENERLHEQLRLATVDQAIAEAEASDAHAENKRLQESLVALEQEAGRG